MTTPDIPSPLPPLSDQQALALRLLREGGRYGVHSFEMRREPNLIANPAARIKELRDVHDVKIAGERQKLNGEARGVRWWLASLAPLGVRPSPESPAGRDIDGVSTRLPSSLSPSDTSPGRIDGDAGREVEPLIPSTQIEGAQIKRPPIFDPYTDGDAA